MAELCIPVVATGAIFVALLFLDMFRREFKYLPGHAIFGTISVLLMSIFCQKGAEFAAWVLLAVPFVALLVGWIIQVLHQQNPSGPFRPNPPSGGILPGGGAPGPVPNTSPGCCGVASGCGPATAATSAGPANCPKGLVSY